MIIQNKPSKYKSDFTYMNGVPNKVMRKKENLVKQKPAAPEIFRKNCSPLTNIHPSYSDSNTFHFSNNSSVKSIKRPKSMDRLKRKNIASNKVKKN